MNDKKVPIEVKSFSQKWLLVLLTLFLAGWTFKQVWEGYTIWCYMTTGEPYFMVTASLSMMGKILLATVNFVFSLPTIWVYILLYVFFYKLIKLVFLKHGADILYRKRLILFWCFTVLTLFVQMYNAFTIMLSQFDSSMDGRHDVFYEFNQYVSYGGLALVTYVSLCFVARFRLALNLKSLYSLSLLVILFEMIGRFLLVYTSLYLNKWLGDHFAIWEEAQVPVNFVVETFFAALPIVATAYFIYKTNQYIVTYNESRSSTGMVSSTADISSDV